MIDLGGRPPRVNGLVVAVSRRRVFIGIGRVGEIESDGVRLRRAAALGGLRPAEMAGAIRRLPLTRRRVLAAALEDDRLADLLEELSEDEQVRIVEGLDQERIARVLDEMDADDAADLLAEFSAARRAELLGAKDPDEAEPVRRLLTYQPDTAGGLMTPEPVILSPRSTVAEALARVRNPDLPVLVAAQVFVTQPPQETPTGRYLGMVGIQRLLREAPSKPIGRCLDEDVEPVDVRSNGSRRRSNSCMPETGGSARGRRRAPRGGARRLTESWLSRRRLIGCLTRSGSAHRASAAARRRSR